MSPIQLEQFSLLFFIKTIESLIMHHYQEIYITFIIYAVCILSIAYWASRSTKHVADFVLGGRKLSGPITALAAGASDMSSWLLMTVPGAVYLSGWSRIWLPSAIFVGAWLNWHWVAKRLRIYSKIANNSLTLPQFFQHRFEDKGLLFFAMSLPILIFFTVYVVAGLVSGAMMLEKVFEIPYHLGLFGFSFIIVLYTLLGGYLGVSWIDFFQGLLMLFSLVVVPLMTFFWIQDSETLSQSWNLIHLTPNTLMENIQPLGIISLLAWGLGYFGQPHILVRFMSVKCHTMLRGAKRICMTWMGISLLGAILTGALGIIYYQESPLSNHETVFVALAQQLFNPWIAGILLSAVLSAIMSTLAAQLLMSATVLVEDIFKQLFPKAYSPQKGLYGIRIAVIAITLIALLMALNPNRTIFSLVGVAWSGLGASFGPLMLFSLYWPKMTRQGAIAGVLSGALSIIIWESLSQLGREYLSSIGILPGFELLPAFVISSLTIIIVSLATQKHNARVVEEFKQIKNILINRIKF